MNTIDESTNITQFEKEKYCNLLECDQVELTRLYDNAQYIFNESDTIYEACMKLLQQGNNVREATFSGILCGRLMGFEDAKNKIELELKDKLFNAFKNNRPF